jgi:steroid 5-alpha reductase family enzyme
MSMEFRMGMDYLLQLLLRLILRQVNYGTMAYWHALALIFYGIRLSLFLLYREFFIPRFQKRDEVQRSSNNRNVTTNTSTGSSKSKNRWISRTPFVIGCATLYACLAAPLLITSQAISLQKTAIVCIVSTWCGFVLASLGDLQKSFIKSVLGEDVLVKGTLFSRLRHPNYTGEALAWTTSFSTSIIVAVTNWKRSYILPLTCSMLGWVGLVL